MLYTNSCECHLYLFLISQKQLNSPLAPTKQNKTNNNDNKREGDRKEKKRGEWRSERKSLNNKIFLLLIINIFYI